MGGPGGIVEVDETLIGCKDGTEVARGFAHKNAVLSLVERRPAGAVVRSEGTSAADLFLILMKHVHPASHMMTDEAGQYTHLACWFMAHDFTTYSKGEYVKPGVSYVHTNTVEASIPRCNRCWSCTLPDWNCTDGSCKDTPPEAQPNVSP